MDLARLRLVVPVLALLVAGLQDGGVMASEPDLPPSLALLETEPGSGVTQVVVAQPGRGRARLGALSHLPDAVVRGAVLPGSRSVLVVADVDARGDGSWGAALFRFDENQAPVLLADRVYHATRPVVAGGMAYVQRGSAGPALPSQLRVDELAIDEIDPRTGASRTVYRGQGYEAHLCASLGSELIVYRVGPAGADLVALDLGTGALRIILSALSATARDFSLEEAHRGLVFQSISDRGERRVERVQLDTGRREILARSAGRDLLPYAWPGGGVLVNPQSREGAEVVGPRSLTLRSQRAVLWARTTGAQGQWIAALRRRSAEPPEAIAIHAADGRIVLIEPRSRMQLEIAGFLGGEP